MSTKCVSNQKQIVTYSFGFCHLLFSSNHMFKDNHVLIFTSLFPTDHVLSEDSSEGHNLHSLSSIVDGIAVEDVTIAFQDERAQN